MQMRDARRLIPYVVFKREAPSRTHPGLRMPGVMAGNSFMTTTGAAVLQPRLAMFQNVQLPLRGSSLESDGGGDAVESGSAMVNTLH